MVFTRQAKLIRVLRHKLNQTQIDFAENLGLTKDSAGAQFVSNMERELAGIPLERLKQLLEMGAHAADIKSAVVGDFREYVANYLE